MLFVLFGFSNGLHTARFLNRDLHSNQLTGTIPDSIGSVSALQYLCVSIELAVSSLSFARVLAENASGGDSSLYRRVVVRWRTRPCGLRVACGILCGRRFCVA